MSDGYGEEARAFREGLRQAAEGEDFEALDPGALKPPGRGRGFDWPAVSAVAVVVVVVALVGVLGTQLRPQATTAGASADAPVEAQASAVPETADVQMASGEAPAGGAESGVEVPEAAPQPTASDQSSQELGEPEPGFRWEVFRGVAVQVPDSWDYGMIPTSAWCITENWPTEPYVSLRGELEAVPAIGCDGSIPADRLVWHVRIADLSALALQELPSPWRYETVEVDGVGVAVASDGSDPDLVEQILGSARVVP